MRVKAFNSVSSISIPRRCIRHGVLVGLGVPSELGFAFGDFKGVLVLFLLGISCILFAGLWHFTVFLSVRLLPFPNMTGFIASLFLSYPFVSHVSNPIRVFLCLLVPISISNLCQGVQFLSHNSPRRVLSVDSSRRCSWSLFGEVRHKTYGVCIWDWGRSCFAFPYNCYSLFCSVLFFFSSSGSAYMVCI